MIILYIFLLILSFLGQIFCADSNICGGDSILSRLPVDAYWTLSRRNPYYTSCKFIHARYNCTRFGATSAADYKIAFLPSMKGNNCLMPDMETILSILQRQTKPVNIMMLGDSHLMQIFQSILCIYQDTAHAIDVYESTKDVTDEFTKLTFNIYKHADECHAIKYKDYDNFFLEPISPMKPGRCQLSHQAGQTTCFKIRINDDIKTINGVRFNYICGSYTRPLVGSDAIIAGLDKGLASIELSMQDFDVLLTNSYISSSDLGSFLKDIDYKGRLYVLPRYPDANQTGFAHKAKTISGYMNFYDHYKIKQEIETFCDTVNQIVILRARKSLEISHQLRANRTGSRSLESGSKFCQYMDYTSLVVQRSYDAKSSIFPMVYSDKNGATKICQEDNGLVNSCVGKDYRVCSKNTLPCSMESHFCLPGPTDEFALLVLAAAINKEDYNISSIIN